MCGFKQALESVVRTSKPQALSLDFLYTALKRYSAACKPSKLLPRAWACVGTVWNASTDGGTHTYFRILPEKGGWAKNGDSNRIASYTLCQECLLIVVPKQTFLLGNYDEARASESLRFGHTNVVVRRLVSILLLFRIFTATVPIEYLSTDPYLEHGPSSPHSLRP